MDKKFSKSDQKFIDEISAQLLRTSSGLRIQVALEYMQKQKYDPFWVYWILNRSWSSCDVVSPQRQEELHRILTRRWLGLFKQKTTFSEKYCANENRQWWLSLPPKIKVFRGCSRNRVLGLCWTADLSVAKTYASGKYDCQIEEPVIASTEVKKENVLFATNDRLEYELLLDYKSFDTNSVEVRDFDGKMFDHKRWERENQKHF